jgi:hypothetical protein
LFIEEYKPGLRYVPGGYEISRNVPVNRTSWMELLRRMARPGQHASLSGRADRLDERWRHAFSTSPSSRPFINELAKKPPGGLKFISLDRAGLHVMLGRDNEMFSWPGKHQS